MMVEKQKDIPDIKVTDVDIFRDTALRYLGKHCINFKMITIVGGQKLLISS